MLQHKVKKIHILSPCHKEFEIVARPLHNKNDNCREVAEVRAEYVFIYNIIHMHKPLKGQEKNASENVVC